MRASRAIQVLATRTQTHVTGWTVETPVFVNDRRTLTWNFIIFWPPLISRSFQNRP
jgi:hypothetical protein